MVCWWVSHGCWWNDDCNMATGIENLPQKLTTACPGKCCRAIMQPLGANTYYTSIMHDNAQSHDRTLHAQSRLRHALLDDNGNLHPGLA